MVVTKVRVGKQSKSSSKNRKSSSQSSSHRTQKPHPRKSLQSTKQMQQRAARPVDDSRVRAKVRSARTAEDAAASGDSDLEDFPQPPKANQFTYLKATTRHVSQDRVITEWKSMPEPAQQRLADLLVAAKRGVVNTAKSAKRAEEMSAAVEPLLRRIVSRLPRMLAPPKTKEENFNLEKLLERSRSLEAQLTASLHSIELLKAEIDREENGLANDEKKLAKMESNVKAEETLWKKQTRRTETSIDIPDDLEMLDDSAADIGLVEHHENIFDLLADESDDDLAPILKQLGDHLISIYGNSMQLQGVTTALEDSSLALEAVLNR